MSRELVRSPKDSIYSVFIRRAGWRNPRCQSGPGMEWGRARDRPITEAAKMK